MTVLMMVGFLAVLAGVIIGVQLERWLDRPRGPRQAGQAAQTGPVATTGAPEPIGPISGELSAGPRHRTRGPRHLSLSTVEIPIIPAVP